MTNGTWFKMWDNLPEHPKIIAAGPAAGWLYVCGIAYCSRLLTDGSIPKALAPRLADLRKPEDAIAALLTVGLWEDGGDSYRVHDYEEHQRTAAEVTAEREAAKDRQRRSRARHAEVTRDTSVSHGNVTALSRRSSTVETETETETEKTVARRKRQARPNDWSPSGSHRQIATTEGLNLQREVEQFCDFHDAKGSLFVDWDRAFNTWLRNARGFGAPTVTQHDAEWARMQPGGIKERPSAG